VLKSLASPPFERCLATSSSSVSLPVPLIICS
jgi:hypothetical protein